MPQVTVDQLKKLLADSCLLKIPLEEIQEDTPFFGPSSLGLDSIDALQMVVAIEQEFGVPIKDPKVARQIMTNLASLREWILRQ